MAMIGQRKPVDPLAPLPDEHKLNWGAIIADALSGLAGQQGQYPQRVARERAEQTEFERGEQRYQRQRADHLADTEAAERRANSKPYRWESNDGSLMEMGPDGMVRQIYKDPTPKPKWVMDPVRGWIDMNDAMPLPMKPRRFDTLPPDAVPVGNGGAGLSTPRTFR